MRKECASPHALQMPCGPAVWGNPVRCLLREMDGHLQGGGVHIHHENIGNLRLVVSMDSFVRAPL